MDKKINFGKSDLIDIIKSSLIAVVTSLVLILVFAIIIKFTGIPDNIIMIINLIIKSVSMVAGMLFGVKTARMGALKGLLSGLLFVGVSYALFAIINMDATFSITMLIDSAIIVAEGLIAGIIAVNVKERTQNR